MSRFGSAIFGVSLFGAVAALATRWTPAPRPMSGPVTTDLIVSRVGGSDPVRLPVADLAASWQVNGGGALSGYAARADVLAAGLMTGRGDDALGRWVSWSHPTAGDWGGRITATRWHLEDGVLELACESWASALLRKRRTARTLKEQAAPPGAHVAAELRRGRSMDTLWLADILADEDGAPVPYNWRGADLYDDLLTDMVDASGFEWTVTADRVFRFGARVGTDLSRTVRLVHPYHVVGGTWVTDLWGAANDILAVATDQTRAEALAVVVEDGDSIAAYGRLQETRDYVGVAHKLTLASVAKADLARSKNPPGTLEDVTVADVDGCWSWFREGDSVRVDLGVANAAITARVMVRAVDLRAGTMALACEVEGDA